CVKDPLTFLDLSKTPVGSNSNVAKFDWDFGDGGLFTGYNLAISPAPPFNYPVGAQDGIHVSHTYLTPNSYKVTLTTTTDLGCQFSDFKYVGQLPVVVPSQSSAFTEYFDTSNGGWIALDIDPKNPIPSPGAIGVSSWKYDGAIGKWTIPVGYNLSEKSALYSACLDLSSIPRPVISFNTNIDLGSGEGVTLQYSTDNLNIQDPGKDWEVLGSLSNGPSPGLNWFNQSAIPSNP